MLKWLNISHVYQEKISETKAVWTHIISLKKRCSTRLGYDSVENWIPLLRSERNFIAQQMNIKPDNFRWYAAFHNESHHPMFIWLLIQLSLMRHS